MSFSIRVSSPIIPSRLFSTLCDNFCLWNREMLTEKDFYDYFAEETISIGFVSTQKPEEPIRVSSPIIPSLA
ncbi:hypothetical protein FXO09_19130 [Microcystis aeruginosa KLA2]|uniref:Uncharacterized protein n=1 Tax=Microcystis aeruginosa DA14 TaxID=1987506 RepID=A0A3E0M758_MICAE|nr:MAG: hypothetical protein DWQ56_15285 [Microcystis aeruginosa DA14]ROI12365.1 hypothetical protein ED562_02095 [Microcystis aeruginosa FACHB-524]TYT69740.1 hypothetical protein FXO09_19130 [Microcystis aeruginosa KLA2]